MDILEKRMDEMAMPRVKQLEETTNKEVASGLWINYFYHLWMTMGYVPHENALVANYQAGPLLVQNKIDKFYNTPSVVATNQKTGKPEKRKKFSMNYKLKVKNYHFDKNKLVKQPRKGKK